MILLFYPLNSFSLPAYLFFFISFLFTIVIFTLLCLPLLNSCLCRFIRLSLPLRPPLYPHVSSFILMLLYPYFSSTTPTYCTSSLVLLFFIATSSHFTPLFWAIFHNPITCSPILCCLFQFNELPGCVSCYRTQLVRSLKSKGKKCPHGRHQSSIRGMHL
jgi:hypothetical protein